VRTVTHREKMALVLSMTAELGAALENLVIRDLETLEVAAAIPESAQGREPSGGLQAAAGPPR
jgi:hypothetical protein